MTRTLDRDTLDTWLGFGLTSALLAAAWHVPVANGLWTTNFVAALAGIGWTIGRAGSRWPEWFRLSRRGVALGALLGSSLVIGTHVAARLVLPHLPAVGTETARLYGMLAGSNRRVWFVPLVVLVATAEELVFRGLVANWLLKRLPVVTAIAVATLLYALPLAASGSWLLVSMGLSLGAIWSVAAHLSRGLVVPLLSHCLWSSMTFALLPLQ